MTKVQITPQERANELLGRIAMITEDLQKVQHDYQQEAEALKADYKQTIDEYKGIIKATEKELIALARKNKKTLFAGGDAVHLKKGSIMYAVRKMVRKAKSVTVDLLESLEWHDGIRVEKSVDWDAIEKWPDERLAAIGTERKQKEDISYELNG